MIPPVIIVGEEIWKDIPGWVGLYQVSSHGRVRSLDRIVIRPQSGTNIISGRILKSGTRRGWYPIVDLCRFGVRKMRTVHRIVAEVFLPKIKGKPHINHKDGHKGNNNISNLEWCTHTENMRHAFNMGFIGPSPIGPGEKCPASKLTEKQVKEIKKRLKGKETIRRIAKDYPIGPSAISEIKAGRSWGHIQA